MEARSRAWGHKGLVVPAGLSLSFPRHPVGVFAATHSATLSDIKPAWAAERVLGARHFAGTIETISSLAYGLPIQG